MSVCLSTCLCLSFPVSVFHWTMRGAPNRHGVSLFLVSPLFSFLIALFFYCLSLNYLLFFELLSSTLWPRRGGVWDVHPESPHNLCTVLYLQLMMTCARADPTLASTSQLSLFTSRLVLSLLLAPLISCFCLFVPCSRTRPIRILPLDFHHH